MESGATRPEPRQPRPVEVWFLLVAVTAVAAAVRTVGGPALVSPWIGAAVAGASAGVVGLPALAWMLDRGRRGLGTAVLLGIGAGSVPPLVFLAGGVLGVFVRGEHPGVRELLRLGAPVPAYGVMPWLAFLRLDARSALVGGASAVVCWLVLFRTGHRRPLTWTLVAATLGATLAVARLLT
jgi:hypothetical protein